MAVIDGRAATVDECDPQTYTVEKLVVDGQEYYVLVDSDDEGVMFSIERVFGRSAYRPYSSVYVDRDGILQFV